MKPQSCAQASGPAAPACPSRRKVKVCNQRERPGARRPALVLGNVGCSPTPHTNSLVCFLGFQPAPAFPSGVLASPQGALLSPGTEQAETLMCPGWDPQGIIVLWPCSRHWRGDCHLSVRAQETPSLCGGVGFSWLSALCFSSLCRGFYPVLSEPHSAKLGQVSYS